MVPEGWQVEALGEIATFRNGLNFLKDSGGQEVRVVGIPHFWQRQVMESFDEIQPIPIGHLGKDDLLQSGDLLFVRSNGNKELIGRCMFFPKVEEPVSFSGFTIRGRMNPARILPEFAAGMMQTRQVKDQIARGGGGTNISNLSQAILSAITIPVPPLPEQKKIAEILSTWDAAIATTRELIANAEAQKSALMQQLLSGKRRLRGFERREWRLTTFGGVCRLSNQKFDPRTAGDDVRCIELEHIESGTGALLGSISASHQSSIKNVYGPNDVLFGKLRPYLRKYVGPQSSGVCSTEIWVLKPREGIVLRDYLFLLVQSEGFIQQANKSSGSKMPRSDWNVVKDYVIRLPEIAEQAAIVEAVTASAEEGAGYSRQRLLLKSEKTALMQQLLTGKRRVTA
ncbi:restriction endonuclease subunit S [Mesorhizobium sp. B2-3-10]|uniref:restriction endonuclease subunit S n=1 Tax=Mesorhizobium sp. B2-3-10 TaxID=2589954 RepID=UPI001128B642|nr:restriction endonuclease subunit S [Mesorhizobium sp. B2-3-10]TPM04541.1 restriction endonuclease subunit S [Mesorhizobium sp. B2-3-10]